MILWEGHFDATNWRGRVLLRGKRDALGKLHPELVPQVAHLGSNPPEWLDEPLQKDAIIAAAFVHAVGYRLPCQAVIEKSGETYYSSTYVPCPGSIGHTQEHGTGRAVMERKPLELAQQMWNFTRVHPETSFAAAALMVEAAIFIWEALGLKASREAEKLPPPELNRG